MVAVVLQVLQLTWAKSISDQIWIHAELLHVLSWQMLRDNQLALWSERDETAVEEPIVSGSEHQSVERVESLRIRLAPMPRLNVTCHE